MKYEITQEQLGALVQFGGHQDFHNEDSLRLELSKLADEIRQQPLKKKFAIGSVRTDNNSYPKDEY